MSPLLAEGDISGAHRLEWVRMRSTIGVVLVVLFCVLFAADPLVCPDGCTEDGGQAAHPVSACAICLGLGPVSSHFVFDSDESVLSHAEVTGLQPEQLFPPPLEHPPQST